MRRLKIPCLIVASLILVTGAGAGAATIFDDSSTTVSLGDMPIQGTARDVESKSSLSQSGWKKLQSANIDAALSDFDLAIDANQNDVHALHGRAVAEVAKSDFNRALKDANYALYVKSSDIDIQWTRGKIYFDINKYKDAIADFKAVLQVDQNFGPAHVLIAQAFARCGERAKAASEFRIAANLFRVKNPVLAKQLEEAARIYQSGSRDDGNDALLEDKSVIVENLAQMYQARSSADEKENGRAIFIKTVKWTNGRTLKVAFSGGDSTLRKFIADKASEWCKYANIKFDFGDPTHGKFYEWSPRDTAYKADIRVAFNHDGYWSVLGQESITAVPPNKQSMNLDPSKWAQFGENYGGTVIHEFGHALGFMHEHEHPGAACNSELRWLDDPGYEATMDNTGTFMSDAQGRQPGLLSYYVSTQKWSPLKTYSQLASFENSPVFDLGAVDTTSIMQYPMDAFLLKTGRASPCFAERNNVLSNGDKLMAKKQYPGR